MSEDQGDQPLSSEELLRRAREGLGTPDSAPEPPPDFSIESYPPPVAQPTPPPAPVEDMAQTPEEPPFEEPMPASPFEPETPVESTPASDPSSWAPPPPGDGGDDWTATAPGPAPVPVKSGGRSIFGKLWIVVVLVIGGFALFSFLDGSKTVDEIAVGDCLNIPEEDVFYEIDPIECSEAHELEVFAIVDLANEPSDVTMDIDFSLSAVYPGDDAVTEAAFAACYDRFEGYVGTPYEESVLYMDVFTPTFEGWTEVDDRIANCLVFEVDANAEAIVMSTGSLQGVAR